MSIDMSQFYQVFFEETSEHLGSMESLLLGLDLGEPDAEQLNAIFRAAHSIKGSAGTFGFTDLAEVTHILENLLDRIRKGELAPTEAMIDAFLAAGDVLKDLLAAHRGEGEASAGAVAAICARLSELTTDSATATPVAVAATGSPAIAPVGAAGYDISFMLADAAQDGAAAIANLQAELGALGTLCLIASPGTADPAWHLRLTGAADTADTASLREIVEYVATTDSIRIAAIGSIAVADEAYGLFDQDDGNAEAADDSFGLFEPLPEAAAPTAADDAFGLFEPLPEAAAPAIADDSFGLFEPLPAATIAAAPAPEVIVERRVAVQERVDRRQPAANAKGGADTSIRVGVERVDQLINLVGELVITQAMLAQAVTDIDPVKYERLMHGMGQLERNTRDLQESVMSIRMMPISVVFGRFPRLVRDLSQKLGKQVELKTVGESTELDKGLIERISDPLNHLVRNSLDHGIEMPEARVKAGKPATGTITLKAYQQSGNVVIEVGDDGAGLNRSRILAKASERGLPVANGMSDQEVWLLIFEPGFSTAESVTEVSGRGVGMDVVKRNITAMGGRVEIESVTGVGTRMTVRLPLTLAILDGMSVAAGAETYIIPLGYVIESLQPSRDMIKSISGVERLIHVRGEYLPVVALYEVFNIPGTVTELDRGILVVIEADGVKAALFVDALVGQHQVVIKNLEANYRRVPGISGATIMGSGHVALILDVAALAGMAGNALPAAV